MDDLNKGATTSGGSITSGAQPPLIVTQDETKQEPTQISLTQQSQKSGQITLDPLGPPIGQTVDTEEGNTNELVLASLRRIEAKLTQIELKLATG